MYSTKTGVLKIKETEKVFVLKQEYLKLNELKHNKIKMRFFFGGTELKDENEIFKYKIKDGYTVQVSKIELE